MGSSNTWLWIGVPIIILGTIIGGTTWLFVRRRRDSQRSAIRMNDMEGGPRAGSPALSLHQALPPVRGDTGTCNGAAGQGAHVVYSQVAQEENQEVEGRGWGGADGGAGGGTLECASPHFVPGGEVV
ncbi:hypothetical protein SKAU_G00418820 [Synaphobranchus kaupii]|uniref:Uncharacterized protein n=1 Tax=Synaphobranchus kaupii TaxID=118154 RepID=A0A9Q1IAX6_SYNKA|nr:hypothetical protein SKAU_G00418820 [Synaphobranchus kaupii]